MFTDNRFNPTKVYAHTVDGRETTIVWWWQHINDFLEDDDDSVEPDNGGYVVEFVGSDAIYGYWDATAESIIFLGTGEKVVKVPALDSEFFEHIIDAAKEVATE